VSVEAVVLLLGADLQGVSVVVKFEARLFLETVLRGGDVGVNFSLEGGGVGGGDASSVEGTLNFVLHFASAREEALFKEFLSVEVDGILRNFAANDTADMSTEIGVKGGDPGGEGWVEVGDCVR